MLRNAKDLIKSWLIKKLLDCAWKRESLFGIFYGVFRNYNFVLIKE